MKYLLILADGMSDYGIAELGGKTPLEYAQTPNMDFLARTSIIGKAKTIPEGFPPGSDVANLAVIGYNPEKYYTGRSPLEAVSMGIELGDNDLAIRCNLVTLSDTDDYRKKTMLDYSSGEISSAESRELIKTLQDELGRPEISFYPGISYRHLLVWRNARGRNITLTPPHDITERVVGQYLPAGTDSSILLDLMLQSYNILKDHPINNRRRVAGQHPATSAWFWGEGSRPALDSFEKLYGLKGSVVAAVDLVKGLGISAGLESVEVPGATGAIETNFAGKARAALDELKRGQDFVYMHIESPDESGHQGSLKQKLWSIERIDQEVVGMIIDELEQFQDLRVMIVPDHPTPLSIRTHSNEPVPFMIFDKNHPLSDSIGIYNEQAADEGILFPEGYKLMEFFIKG
ncbi:MAG: cofactor-independent phosphoglycerate mutase [Syntrophomonadaceae bacterium]|jgi:2,3-bisphosphoglycerate-independent phosphoglycerate mutase|nr:cofactor-independent phosphoglycerate mutase [Syntrophomonadaceae bacterium]